MALDVVQVRGSDGLVTQVLVDNVTGQAYSFPLYKLGLGALGVDDGPVSASNPLPINTVTIGSIKDPNNSTTTLLGPDGVYTGTGVDCLGYSTVCVTIHADVDSATDGMSFQFSTDNSNWDDLNIFELDTSESMTRRFQFPVTAQYFRIVYTNGSSGQAAFRVQTILHTANQLSSVHRLKDNVHDDRSVTVVKSVVFAQQAGGTDDFVCVQATSVGNFKVSLEEVNGNVAADADTGAGTDNRHAVVLMSAESGGGVLVGSANPLPVNSQLVDENGVAYGVKHIGNKPRVSAMSYQFDIAEGNVPDHVAINKFGHNSSVGAALEPVWDYSGPYEYLADDTFAIMYISSDAAADQGMDFEVTGIDSDYNYSTVTVTTDGADGRTFVALTSDAADNKWWRIFKARNASGTDQTGNIYISKDNTDAGGDGIPDTVADIQAQVLLLGQQTLMAQWTSPVGNITFLTSYYAATSNNKITEVHLYVRPFGGVFNIKHIISINQGHTIHNFDFPISIAAKSDIVVRAMATGGGGEVSAGFDLWYEAE